MLQHQQLKAWKLMVVHYLKKISNTISHLINTVYYIVKYLRYYISRKTGISKFLHCWGRELIKEYANPQMKIHPLSNELKSQSMVQTYHHSQTLPNIKYQIYTKEHMSLPYSWWTWYLICKYLQTSLKQYLFSFAICTNLQHSFFYTGYLKHISQRNLKSTYYPPRKTAVTFLAPF